jgi:hypothetical protein
VFPVDLALWRFGATTEFSRRTLSASAIARAQADSTPYSSTFVRTRAFCASRFWARATLSISMFSISRHGTSADSPRLPARGRLPRELNVAITCELLVPTTPAWFLRMVQRTGKAAKLPFQVHPHMLRHSTGYKLANDGHDTRSLAHYLGHRNLQSTARYTALAPDRFAKFWRD